MNVNTARTVGAEAGAAAAEAVNDTATKTSTRETITTKLGIFGRAARAMKRHPIPTSVGLSVGTVAATVGAVNYRRTGSVAPGLLSGNDVVEVARAIGQVLR
jgi:hypothetical protein